MHFDSYIDSVLPKVYNSLITTATYALAGPPSKVLTNASDVLTGPPMLRESYCGMAKTQRLVSK